MVVGSIGMENGLGPMRPPVAKVDALKDAIVIPNDKCNQIMIHRGMIYCDDYFQETKTKVKT